MLLPNSDEIGASIDFFKRILMPIVFSLSWLWYIATNALRFGRPLEFFVVAGAVAAADDVFSLFDRPADFLFDSFRAIANDFGLPPPETGDFFNQVDLGTQTLD